MNESYRPGIFDKSRADRVIKIEDDEAYHTARLLAKKEGLFVGMSSGAAMAIALKVAKELTEGMIVVILPDGGGLYLSTPLFAIQKRSSQLFYNTLTRKKEEFIPIEENRVRIYTCGPTLCQNIHIGQCRRFLLADLLRRHMEFKGYAVTHVMNVTDLDDRTIEGAEKGGVSLKDYTEAYYQAFLKDLDSLNIKRANEYPRPSMHVQDMIQLTQKLLEKGFAYEKFRSIYFDISRFKDYGKLSNIDLEKIKVGKTVDLEQYEKDNPRDFTLLKRSTLNELKKGISYQTPWGNIRPSWHMECPVMAMKYLGETYDIHASGIDLLFPHHENIMAISQAITGKPPANYWLHNELVMIDGKKPSQHPHNDYTIRQLLKKGITGREIRYWLISRHYRKPVSFSWASLEAAKKTIANLDRFVAKFRHCHSGASRSDIDQLVYNLKHQFTEALDDDLNIAPALATVFQFTKELNRIMTQDGLSSTDTEKIEKALKDINSVLGVMNLDPEPVDDDVEKRLKLREAARKTGDWDTADQIRRELKAQGIEVIDTKEGTIWRMEKGSFDE